MNVDLMNSLLMACAVIYFLILVRRPRSSSRRPTLHFRQRKFSKKEIEIENHPYDLSAARVAYYAKNIITQLRMWIAPLFIISQWKMYSKYHVAIKNTFPILYDVSRNTIKENLEQTYPFAVS